MNPKESVTHDRHICPSKFTATLFTIAMRQNQPTCPSTDSENVDIYTVECCSLIKKYKIMKPSGIRMGLEKMTLNEETQAQIRQMPQILSCVHLVSNILFFCV